LRCSNLVKATKKECFSRLPRTRHSYCLTLLKFVGRQPIKHMHVLTICIVGDEFSQHVVGNTLWQFSSQGSDNLVLTGPVHFFLIKYLSLIKVLKSFTSKEIFAEIISSQILHFCVELISFSSI
jgi:hypothetical protein